ncbi:disease resistance protein RPV1-like isoform X2 [Humulus lupulus]|uniref:disease resistance protein RPV1-like isoform X2 n=1 Tax=Humulus lupulus TaxID=3486 RepID=UPI002B4142E9|nr:disease resistance protein RPV1-like isoform X2 [Humulus lupulus]
MAIGEGADQSTLSGGVTFRLRWDVFLSFRGEDTRDNVTKSLYESLEKKGVRTFRDDDGLNRGEEIAPSLLEAIDDSAAAVVIFSKRYADSRWCLEELAKICESPNKLILPVFCEVAPGDVRKQIGPYEKDFQHHEKNRSPELVERWRKALNKIGNISGWVIDNSEKSEVVRPIIQSIVEVVLRAISKTPMGLAPYTVGLNSRIEEVMEKLEVKSNGVRVFGMHGMGGIGKTTLAKALFNKLVGHFELHSFISNVREVPNTVEGQISLQNKLIDHLSGCKNPHVSDLREGHTAIKMVVNEKRVLVVLDDVDNVCHLHALMSKKDVFYDGSRIIITTRDITVLEGFVDLEYEVKVLDQLSALELFSYHAQGRKKPRNNFENLSNQIVSLTGHLPLALEVIGSMLFDKRTIKEWDDATKKLKEIRPDNLQGVLEVSYNALDEEEKCIFLDISCLFVNMGMDRDYAIDVLKGCGFDAEIAISKLTTKSLIKITQDNTLWVHDQLRDMGRHIVKHENVVDPCMRSRLWNREEIMTVLLDDKRTKDTQGIVLDFKGKSIVKDVSGGRISWNNFRSNPSFTNAITYLTETFKDYQQGQAEKKREVKIFTKPFETMVKLRLLQTNYANLEGEFKFPVSLKWLQLKGCPLTYLPSAFCALGLSVLDLSDSKMKRVWAWYTKNMADSVKVLNLRGCSNLVAIPNLSKNKKLEKLILGNCVSLTKIDEYIGNMSTLIHLNLRDCLNLVKLPTDVSGLKQLQILILSGCIKLKELPANINSLKSLKELLVDDTAIEKLPESIFGLTQLEKLSLNRCRYLKRLPHCIGCLCSLKDLSLNNSGLDELPDSIGSLENLEILSVMWCPSLTSLPDSVGKLKLLRELLILASPITELPVCIGTLPNLKQFSLGKGRLLSTLPHSIGGLISLVELDIDETSITHLPDQIGAMKSLKKLNLWKCKSLRSLPESIGSILSLTTLTITEAEIIELPESIGMLDNLTMIRLTNCRKLLKLPASIGNLKFLYRLLMEDTAVTELPDSFGKLSSLIVLRISKKPQVVGLSKNNEPNTSMICSSQEARFFPPSFSNLSSLSELDARARNISGKIPNDFEKLVLLEILNLGHNSFSSLPSSLKGLSYLKELLLPHCNELRSLPPLPSSLRWVNCAHCTSLENISDISNLESLEELNLTNCAKVEDIPGLECLKSLRRVG